MTPSEEIRAAMVALTPTPSIDPSWDDVLRRVGGSRRRRRAVLAAVVAAAALPALAFGGFRLIDRQGNDLHGAGRSEALGLRAEFTGRRVRTFQPVGGAGPRFGGLRWRLEVERSTAERVSAYLRVPMRSSSLRLRLCSPCGSTSSGVVLRPGLWLGMVDEQRGDLAVVEILTRSGKLRFAVRR